MRRSVGYALGVAGIAVAFVLAFGAGLSGAHGGLAASHAPNAVHGPTALAGVHPNAGPPGARITYTSTIATYSVVPFTVSFSVALTNVSPVDNTTLAVAQELLLITPDCDIHNPLFSGVPCPEVTNESLAVAPGQTSFSVTIDMNYLTLLNYNGGNIPADSQFTLNAWATATNSTGSNVTVGAAVNTFLVLTTPGGAFLSPTLDATYSAGNQTLSGWYVGDFVGGANITVYSEPSGGLSFTQGVFTPGIGEQTWSVAWPSAAAGKYMAVLLIVTPYQTSSAFANFTVLGSAANQIIYLNSSQTTWVNTTGGTSGSGLFGGLSPGASAAILLVVGLIIGMIVALALGMMMWGSGPASPAQPWSSSKGSNECSVCHQSFGSADELAEHSKQAHGMT